VPSFDPFGLKKETVLEASDDASEPAPAAPAGPQNLKTAKKVLGGLLALTAAFLLVCVGGLAARVRRLAQQPRLETAPPAPAPKTQAPAEQSKPAPPAPAEKKPEPPKTPPAAPAKDAKAPPPPAKTAPPPAKPQPTPAKAQPAPPPPQAAQAPAKPSTTRKVEFTHADPSAKEAHLVGAFLVRSKGRTPMTRYSTGEWRITVTLVSGTTYSYRIETSDAQGKPRMTKKQAVFVAP